MLTHKQFQKNVDALLSDIDPKELAYDVGEFWMVQSSYEYIYYYSIQNQLQNTYIALQLARGFHDGVHRKLSIVKYGKSYRLPYLIHPLKVCRMLIDIQIPLSHQDLDVLLASALCHDMIEDCDFPEHGKELYKKYHLDPKVYETVKFVSKRKDFTEEEEQAHFHDIETHPLALLVKLSDRGNNVEDLYNMSIWKVHEYVGETNKYFIPMCDYGIEKYPVLSRSFEILKDKIVTLISIALILVDRYSEQEMRLQEEIDTLRKENDFLREQWRKYWED
ncbi:MAG: hypothetical protein Q4C49_04750 [Bacillota bacterium]|nr:hypothetical protein [Bacillota bacterium]